jgi:Tfp pilus assembly protein PilX
MTTARNDERGSAMVLAIGVLAVVAIMAIIIVAVVVSEKRTSASAYSQDRAFYSADAATEAGVNWIRNQRSPAATVDSINTVGTSAGTVALATDHSYTFNVRYVRRQYRPGWSAEYKDYVYSIEAQGTSAQQSQAALEVNATRLYREGY